MMLARVQGHVVASQKDAQIVGTKLLVVEPLKVVFGEGGGGTYEPTGRALVAVDRIGAGEGQLVLLVQGSSARMVDGCSKMPVDTVVVGLIDEAVVAGGTVDPASLNR